MTTGYRKKLIEVSLPLAAINAESAREKSIRHGHPSTLHLWWARRPLATCRAVLFASLVDDPDSDPAYRNPDGSVDEDRAGIKRADLFNFIEELVAWENSNNADVIRTAQSEIARCVASRLIETGTLKKDTIVGGKTTVWDLVTKGHCHPQPMGLDKKAGRVRFVFDVSRLPPADVVNAFLTEHAPPVLDPFAGGGSIPLEAQRLGLRPYASDLNPVPVLINKALIEIPSKFSGRSPVNPETRGDANEPSGKGKKKKSLIQREWPGATGLADDVRYYGQWMRDEAEKRIGHLYPRVEVTKEMVKERPDLQGYVGQKLTVIAWLWARTVASPNPACNGTFVPLVKSFWLSKKDNRKVWIVPEVFRDQNSYEFRVVCGEGKPPDGTVGRSGGRCLLSNDPISLDYIRGEGKAGRLHSTLLAIVAEGKNERVYLSPHPSHIRAAEVATPPNAPLEEISHNPFALRPPLYGLKRFSDLFTSRQLTALLEFSSLVQDARARSLHDSQSSELVDEQLALEKGGIGRRAYADAIATYLALGVSKLSDRGSTMSGWDTGYTKIRNAFGRQALAMTWDYAEVNPFSSSTGNWLDCLSWTIKSLESWNPSPPGNVMQLDATSGSWPQSNALFSTDPPYYNNIDYADLSDFFYVWIRRCLGAIYPTLLSTVLTPKAQELVATPYRHDGSMETATRFFESGLKQTFRHMRDNHAPDFPLTVFYAFKQSEESDEDEEAETTSVTLSSTGWETMLAALIEAGFSIHGTWPVRTEMKGRMMSAKMNALASSIILVCRPRRETSPLATRKEFVAALRRELPVALRNLQHGNIAPVDLAQSAIGPGMSVFTRYSKVLESDGSSLTVRTSLGLINQALDEVLAEQEGEFDSDTRWALSWFEQFGMDEGPFGDAETLSKAKNTAINGLVEAGIIVAKSGKVRLIRREELPLDWNPANDRRLTVWEVAQHLIRRLDEFGETGASELVNQLGSVGEIARDLAYRLYSTCERKKWAQEALAYNSLVVAWPELTKLAQAARSRVEEPAQRQMF